MNIVNTKHMQYQRHGTVELTSVQCFLLSIFITVKTQPGEALFWTSDAQIQGTYSPGRPHFNTVATNVFITNGKVKAIPLQALTGPEGSRRLRLPDFKTIGT
jgi:hypothetical protein